MSYEEIDTAIKTLVDNIYFGIIMGVIFGIMFTLSKNNKSIMSISRKSFEESKYFKILIIFILLVIFVLFVALIVGDISSSRQGLIVGFGLIGALSDGSIRYLPNENTIEDFCNER